MNKKIPARRCVACNEQKEKNNLLRIVRTPEGNIEIDQTGKKNGRGAYICKNIDCLNKVIKSKRLEKNLDISIDNDFYEEIRRTIVGE
jgi:predicted RNA-binding protein YlxR (DUF448 family)